MVFDPQGIYIWVNYNDLTATSLEIIVRVRGIIPKWPQFRLVKYYNLPMYIPCTSQLFLVRSRTPRGDQGSQGLFGGTSIMVHGKITMLLMGKSTIEITIFNRDWIYWLWQPLFFLDHAIFVKIHRNRWIFPWKLHGFSSHVWWPKCIIIDWWPMAWVWGTSTGRARLSFDPPRRKAPGVDRRWPKWCWVWSNMRNYSNSRQLPSWKHFVASFGGELCTSVDKRWFDQPM